MVIQTGNLRVGISRVDRQKAERSGHLGRLIVEDGALEIVIKLLNTRVFGLAIAEDLGVALTQLGDGLLKVQDGDALLKSFLNIGDLLVLQRSNLALKSGDSGALLVMGLGTDRLASEQGIHILLAPVFSIVVGRLGLGVSFGLGLGDEYLGAGHNQKWPYRVRTYKFPPLKIGKIWKPAQWTPLITWLVTLSGGTQ